MPDEPAKTTQWPPPLRDYLDVVTWPEALRICDEVSEDHPELAGRYLKWLVQELRYSLLGELPASGPPAGWFAANPSHE